MPNIRLVLAQMIFQIDNILVRKFEVDYFVITLMF